MLRSYTLVKQLNVEYSFKIMVKGMLGAYQRLIGTYLIYKSLQ